MASIKCRVEFDYAAEQDDELSLKAGDIVTNVSKEEGGWWEGEINGKRGMFPDNFVEEIKATKPVETKSEPKQTHHKEATPNKDASTRKSHHGSNITALQDKLGKGLAKAGAPAPVKHRDAGANKHKRAKVAYSYAAENEDEISLEPGSEVEIIKEEEEGWYLGISNGKKGVFPSNFVELVEEKEEPEEVTKEESKPQRPPPASPVAEETRTEESPPPQEPKPKKVHGVGLGNIFSGGPIKLRPTGGNNALGKKEPKTIGSVDKPEESLHKTESSRDRPPSQPPPSLPPRIVKPDPSIRRHDQNQSNEPSTGAPAMAPVPRKHGERAKAIFSYSAENDDELSIAEGDVVTVLDKELDDGGWWKGELNGKTGVFPDNFVELLPPEEPKPGKPAPPIASRHAKPELPPVNEKSSEPHKRSTKKEERELPNIPAKKPVLPPPVGKKPGKPTDVKLLVHTDDYKVKEDALPAKESNKDVFDGLLPSPSEVLTHLTASRPKQPAKRPPSTINFKKELTPPTENHNEEQDKKPPPQVPPMKKQDSNSEESKESVRGPTRPASTYVSSLKSHEPKISPITAASSETIVNLEKQIKELKHNSVSKDAFNELKKENEKLRHDLDHLKTNMDKKTKMLINDVDEEKKARLIMQVELERLKKLVE